MVALASSDSDNREAIRRKALRATAEAIRPIVSMLLDAGVSSHDLAYVVRRTVVQETLTRIKTSGRRASTSSIAAATGLTRPEVRQLLTATAESDERARWAPRASERVLAGWLTDTDFLDAHGAPRRLRYSESAFDFQELTRRYSRDIPPRAMLNEMIDAGVVAEVAPGEYVLRDPLERAPSTDANALSDFGFKVSVLGSTLLKNLRDDRSKRVFETLMLAGPSSTKQNPKIRRELDRRCRTFSRSIERFLLDQSAAAPDLAPAEAVARLGVLVAVVQQYPPDDIRDDAKDEYAKD